MAILILMIDDQLIIGKVGALESEASQDLVRYEGALPTIDYPDWRPAPLVEGDWSASIGEAAHPSLDLLAALLRRVGNEDLLDRVEAGSWALRLLPLSFYPGWTLGEVGVQTDAGLGVLSFLVNSEGGRDLAVWRD